MTIRSKFDDVDITRAAEQGSYARAAVYLTSLGKGKVSRQLARHWCLEQTQEPDPASGVMAAPDQRRRVLEGRRFIVTSAQNNTRVHRQFFRNLEHYAQTIGATLLVSRFSYNKSAWQRSGTKDDADLWYDPAILPYVMDDPAKIELAPVVVAGELDILPTMASPVSGLTNYARGNSLIVPHAKMQMQSVATPKGMPANFVWTTGACTQRNYIARRTGQIADFHHVYGAMLVEADGDRWFARQLIAGEDGSFYDLDLFVSNQTISTGNRALTITAGDIHIGKPDKANYNVLASMIGTLRPDHLLLHDLLDFTARNHHNLGKPVDMFEMEMNRHKGHVEQELHDAASFVYQMSIQSRGTAIHVVRSNHDEALDRWLDEADPVRKDPRNAILWLKGNLRRFEQVRDRVPVNILPFLMREITGHNLEARGVNFLRADDSLILADIEHGMHGHYGPNGARGSVPNLSKIGFKANIGHGHSAMIKDGVWMAGVLGADDMGYNKGPSAWSPTSIITHQNGKRQMVTFNSNSWRL